MIRLPLLLLLVSLTAGCALTTDEVALEYKPLTPATAVAGAQNVSVSVSYVEGRTTNQDRVSVKKNGYGMEMAPIVTKQPLSQLVLSAISDELRHRGFTIGGGNVFVSVEVDKFFNDFKVGFFSADAVAEVTISCQVKNAVGAILYARTVTGTSDVTGVMLASGTNAKLALDQAFPAALARVVNDPDFIQALLHAATPVAQGGGAGGGALGQFQPGAAGLRPITRRNTASWPALVSSQPKGSA